MAVDVNRERRAPAPTATIPPDVVDGPATEAYYLTELRTYVLLLGFVATVAYPAGMNPPAVFSSDNGGAGARLAAGDPVLQATYPLRYLVFFYCNATAFVASLMVILLLLLSNVFSKQRIKYCALRVAMALALFGLVGAFATCRSLESYLMVLLPVAVLVYVGVQVLVFLFKAGVKYLLPGVQETWESLDQQSHPQHDTVSDSGQGNHTTCGRKNNTPEAPKRVEIERSILLIFAMMAATITYQAGLRLRTPSAFWQGSHDSDYNHLAGDPMLRVHHPDSFMVFFYSNTTAFVASLVIIMLPKRNIVRDLVILFWACWACSRESSYAVTAMVMLTDTGAFVPEIYGGSLKTSMYDVALMAAVLSYIVIQPLVFPAQACEEVDPQCARNTWKAPEI